LEKSELTDRCKHVYRVPIIEVAETYRSRSESPGTARTRRSLSRAAGRESSPSLSTASVTEELRSVRRCGNHQIIN